MSAHRLFDDDLKPVADAKRDWTVYRCAHGCFHVALDRVTLTLTEDELDALQDLLHRARLLHELGSRGSPAVRPH